MGTKDTSTPNLDRIASSLQGGWKSEIYPCLLHGEGTSPYFCRRRVEIRILPLDPPSLGVIVTIQLTDWAGKGHHLVASKVE